MIKIKTVDFSVITKINAAYQQKQVHFFITYSLPSCHYGTLFSSICANQSLIHIYLIETFDYVFRNSGWFFSYLIRICNLDATLYYLNRLRRR